jgi:radical SAM protein (TIGR01212 family)
MDAIKRTNDFPTFLQRFFSCKVQKISINAGFTCPNRDGMKGRGGCTYCNNQSFNPDYCRTEKSVAQQLQEGKQFFARKYPDMKYLAYFQAYTNSYGELDELKRKYEEALSVTDVVGLVIGTRPDCMPDALLRYLEELSRSCFLLVEYGIETTREETLRRINRGHTFAETVDALNRTAAVGILTGGHVILGLPGETKEMIIEQAAQLSALPLNTLKLHQLQLIRGTAMAHEYLTAPDVFHLFRLNEYLDLLLAPDWGLKNHEFTALLLKRMEERDIYQGKLYGQ